MFLSVNFINENYYYIIIYACNLNEMCVGFFVDEKTRDQKVSVIVLCKSCIYSVRCAFSFYKQRIPAIDRVGRLM